MLTRSQSARLVACLLLALGLFVKSARAADQSSVTRMIISAAHRHGVPPRLALGVVRVESGLRCNARNGRARGVMQVFPQTAHSVGVHGNLLDCATGIEAGVRYLRLALDRAGSLCGAASPFNKGIAARPSCNSYARKVMRQS